jgi:7-cyano-7-deazaguanine synthase
MSKLAILLSGGMDSYSLTYYERPDIAITIDYGQRPAEAEIKAARLLAKRLEIHHEVVRVDLKGLGSGDLSENPAISSAPASDWWPYRNQALITVAAMRVITMTVNRLLIGTVNSDSIHKDGAPEFISLMDQLLYMQEGRIRVEAPAVALSTVQLVRMSGIPYSLLAWAHSCHTGNIACGQCRGCYKHSQVVEELGYAKD